MTPTRINHQGSQSSRLSWSLSPQTKPRTMKSNSRLCSAKPVLTRNGKRWWVIRRPSRSPCTLILSTSSTVLPPLPANLCCKGVSLVGHAQLGDGLDEDLSTSSQPDPQLPPPLPGASLTAHNLYYV